MLKFLNEVDEGLKGQFGIYDAKHALTKLVVGARRQAAREEESSTSPGKFGVQGLGGFRVWGLRLRRQSTPRCVDAPKNGFIQARVRRVLT